jgi:hypothetical protein
MLVELGRMHGTHRNQTSFLHTLIRPCLVFLCTSLWSRHDPKVSQEKWLQHIPRYLFAPTADLTFYVLIKFSPWIGRKRLGWVAAAVLLLPFDRSLDHFLRHLSILSLPEHCCMYLQFSGIFAYQYCNRAALDNFSETSHRATTCFVYCRLTYSRAFFRRFLFYIRYIPLIYTFLRKVHDWNFYTTPHD